MASGRFQVSSLEFRGPLREWFGDIDVYLFDQLLRGRITSSMRILDAGCGTGRNLVYFMRQGFSVHGVDASKSAIAEVRALAKRLAPGLPPENFRVEPLEKLSLPTGSFDVVICNAVLHFATDEAQFKSMLDEIWRVLAGSGMLWARLASSIGIEDRIQLIEGRKYLLPNGSERFLVDEKFLLDATAALGGSLLDPIKTTNVQGQRCMTTWCVGKDV